MYLAKTPKIVQRVFPRLVWRIPTDEKKVFLTFDDGPVPGYTDYVLSQLAQYDAKATFFCVGDNARRHHAVFQRVAEAGHAIGSHTFNHLSGWSTEDVKYFNNVRYGASMVSSQLFRPPYGQLSIGQAGFLSEHYSIIMWDVLSGDYSEKFTAQQCVDNVVQNVVPGSIVVFHDSAKAFGRLEGALPEVLRILSEDGYIFDRIDKSVLSQNLVRRRA